MFKKSKQEPHIFSATDQTFHQGKKQLQFFVRFVQPLLFLLRVFEYSVNWSSQDMNLVVLRQQLLHVQLLTLTEFLTSTLDQIFLNLTLTLKLFLKPMVTRTLIIFLRQNISWGEIVAGENVISH